MLFARDENAFSGSVSFAVAGEGSVDCYVAGVAAGQWEISIDGTVTETVTVGEGSGILTFTASAGTVALVSRHEPVSRG
jgi:hypothetical protein